MKLVFFPGIFYVAYQLWGFANAQYYEDSTIYFKKFDFDWINRGAFNISECLKDLMDCYELVRADLICMKYKNSDTVCVTTRGVCHDYHLDYDDYGFPFIIGEQWCKDGEYNDLWT